MLIGLLKDSVKYEERYRDKLIDLAKSMGGWYTEEKMKQQLIGIGIPVDTFREKLLAQWLFEKLDKGISYDFMLDPRDASIEGFMRETVTIRMEKTGTSFGKMYYRLNYKSHLLGY
jgi:hypothetical protein